MGSPGAQQRTIEHIVDVSVPSDRFVGEIVEVLQLVPQPRVQQRTDVLISDVPMSQFQEILEVVPHFSRERISERIMREIVDVEVPQIQEDTVEVIQPTLQERFSERIVEQIINVPVPQIQEQSVDVVNYIPHERVPQSTVNQIVETPVPQLVEDTVNVIHFGTSSTRPSTHSGQVSGARRAPS